MAIDMARQNLLTVLCNIIFFLDGGHEKLINFVTNSLFTNLRINCNSTNKKNFFYQIESYLTFISRFLNFSFFEKSKYSNTLTGSKYPNHYFVFDTQKLAKYNLNISEFNDFNERLILEIHFYGIFCRRVSEHGESEYGLAKLEEIIDVFSLIFSELDGDVKTINLLTTQFIQNLRRAEVCFLLIKYVNLKLCVEY